MFSSRAKGLIMIGCGNRNCDPSSKKLFRYVYFTLRTKVLYDRTFFGHLKISRFEFQERTEPILTKIKLIWQLLLRIPIDTLLYGEIHGFGTDTDMSAGGQYLSAMHFCDILISWIRQYSRYSNWARSRKTGESWFDPLRWQRFSFSYRLWASPSILSKWTRSPHLRPPHPIRHSWGRGLLT